VAECVDWVEQRGLARGVVADEGADSGLLNRHIHDFGGGVAGWVDSPSGNLWTFLTAGGISLAGSYTSGGTTTTWVPLTDLNGSTIALENAGWPTSPPGATYTYDPSGNVSVTGSNATSWPFEYQGMEHELTDPANLYFNGASNVYNPQIQNMLSQVGAQGLGGPSAGNPAGPGASPPSGTSGGLTWQSYQNDLGQARQVGLATLLGGSLFTRGEEPVAVPAALTAYVVDFLVNFFEDIFGGGSSPPIPRQLMHRRHPLYAAILGIDSGLIPTEGPAGTPPAPTAGPCPPVPGPPGILRRNIDLARKHGTNPFYLLTRVCPGCVWDYKSRWGYTQANDDFGNFNAGAVAAAAGYPDQLTLRAAGLEHQCAGTMSGNERGNPFGSYPYGNNEHSEAEVAQGIDYVEMGCDR